MTLPVEPDDRGLAHEDRAAALAILHRAADVCDEQEMSTPEVFAALIALEARATRRGVFQQFRAALTVPDPQARQAAASEALSGIERVLGTSSPDQQDDSARRGRWLTA